jgi:iron complex transport system substrate-binding protein
VKLKRLGIFIALLSLLVSVVAGCQPQFQPGDFTDDMGREVTINEVPQRIISFGPNITEILFALGLGEKVVGVSDFSDYPEAAQEIDKIGNAFSPSLEKIVELEPDLVLTVEHEQLNTELEALGLTFMILEPRDIDGILDDIELVGKVTGTEKAADDLVKEMRDSISRITALVEDTPEVSVFFIIDGTDLTSPWTVGPASFIHALITMAGGENVAMAATGDWVQFSIEQVVSADPDIIIIQTMTGGIPTVSKEVLEENAAWREMTAVKENRIYFINGDIVSRPGPRITQGLEGLAEIIHPELFE